MSTPKLRGKLTHARGVCAHTAVGLRLGQELVRLRSALGLTQADVAAQLGLKHASQVSKWESGKVRPQAETYPRLAQVLRTTASHLRAVEPPFDPAAPRKGPDAEPRTPLRPATPVGLDPEEQWLVQAWRALPAAQHTAARAMIVAYLSALGITFNHPPSLPDRRAHA